MLDSPVRTDIAKQLAEGKAGILILLTGSDAAANEGAEKVTKELIADVGAGKVELYLPPGMSEEAEDGKEKAHPGLQLGLAKVARTDPAEKWLVDSLFSMEDDLMSAEFASQPMIFAVFGRGRALPPFVGKGITRDNLLECVYFLTGACSCTVKDQNPGMDLLFAENWWTVAEKLASTFGAEEGNESQLGAAQLFPHLMIPGGQQVAEAPKEPAGPVEAAKEPKPPAEPAAPAASAKPTEATGAKAAAEKEGDAAVAKPAAMKEQPQDQAIVQPEKQPLEEFRDKPRAEPQGRAKPSASQPAETPETPAPSATMEPADTGRAHAESVPEAAAVDAIGIFAVGAGLCVALVLLFGVTFLVMRPK
jgi:hypothetical protein